MKYIINILMLLVVSLSAMAQSKTAKINWMTVEEVQEKMMTGYQEYLDSEWIRQLKEKYPVKIDPRVLEEVKNILKNE